MIEITGLYKHYGKGGTLVRALDGIDLSVHSGEILMLAGPSGSGKTTLLSIMGCILSGTSGSIKIDDREVGNLSTQQLPAIRLRYFGFVFQDFNLFPALTARENVEIAFKLKGISGRKARLGAEELLSKLGLSQKFRKVPADLSGGEKQRVAIARALAGDPPVLLADEPTAALDSYSGATVLKILADLATEDRRTVVVVTHDPRALAYATRTVRLEDGKILHTTEERFA